MTNEGMTTENVSSDQTRSKRMEMIIRQLETLPTLPVVATKLLQATTAKDTSIKEVISLIQSDQSLTAKILGLTRKAHLGLGPTISTVEKAVVMLGFEAVRNAVLSIQVFEAFGPKEARKPGDKVEPEPFDRPEFWKHCLAVACAAQLIVEQIPSRKINADEVFVCGLLHDLGKVALDACLPKSFARVVEIAVNNRTSIADVERRILGLDHAAIGKRLADHWKLPEMIHNAIWLHHHKSSSLPEKIQHRDLIDVIYLADLIAREQRIGFSGNFLFADRSEPLAQRLGVTAEGYQKVLLDLRGRMGERAALIGLDDLSSELLYQQALQAANAELGRLNQSLSISNRQLKSRSRYFEAVNLLHQKLGPAMPIGEVLSHLAATVQSALDVPAVIVYRHDPENRYTESVFADPAGHEIRLFEHATVPAAPPPDTASADAFLGDPPPVLAEVIAHYARKLSPHPVRRIPLSCRETPIGGILLSADSLLADRLGRERPEIETLCTTCALALGQCLALEAKDRLADDLLGLTRQMQEMEQSLVETRALAAVGELAAGAAHELNNPLAIVSGRAQLLLDQDADPDRQKALNVIVTQAAKASEIITELMEFAKPVRPQRKLHDVAALVQSAADDFVQARRLKPDRIRVEVPKGSTVFCDDRQILAALKEILANALEATSPEELSVDLKVVAEDNGQFVQIRVADQGPGMDAAVLAKALDPFFSARKAGRGRGLGLSRAYRYVQSNNGTLWIESAPTLGTTVFIRLPAREPGKDAKG